MSADGGHDSPRRATRDLSALLGSRICHDLISPLGAIGNGVELLSMSGISGAPEIALIAESVESANARIRFFRIAFGAASIGQAIPQSEVLDILGAMNRGGRLTIHWKVEGPLERVRVKLAFLLLQCLETAMPFGGEITISGSETGWFVLGKADRLKIDPDIWALLLVEPNVETDVSPAHVQFALVSDAAARAGRTLSTTFGEAEIRIGC
ncbi:MAG: histidine phosphotransferase family protein [Pseudomonadota bacterium]